MKKIIGLGILIGGCLLLAIAAVIGMEDILLVMSGDKSKKKSMRTK
jgi:hypothetical protein